MTLMYGALTRKREESEPGQSGGAQPPGVGTYVDALAALVPAEVLAIHAIVISLATTSANGVATITAKPQLGFWFWFLAALAVAFYIAGLQKRPTGWNLLRMLVPAFAFIGWTMLQPTTAFDGIAPDFDHNSRWTLGLAIAIVVGFAAGALGMQADRSPSQKAEAADDRPKDQPQDEPAPAPAGPG